MAAAQRELQGVTKYWTWQHLHDVSFAELKALIMTNTILKPINPDRNQTMYLVCDSSDTGMAVWIGQKQQDGLVRPVRFRSRKFRDLCMNYVVKGIELLDIADCVRHFRAVS